MNNTNPIVHLQCDTDYLGYTTAWCSAAAVRCVELPATVTCRECLEAIANFAATCANRLNELSQCDSSTGQESTVGQAQEEAVR